jgi:valyl-tRNA synthetase
MTLADKWILSRLATAIAETTDCLDKFKFSEPINGLYKFFWNDFCDWYLEWVKPRIQDKQQKPIAQNVLAFVLDQILRLLHPFVPFITEGIFQKLNELAPNRKLKDLAEVLQAEALVIAAWPEKIDHLRDAEAETNIELIQTAIRTIRDIRSKYNIAPSRAMMASASAPRQITETLNANCELICQLANLAQFEAGEAIDKPDNAAAAIVEQMQIYLHDAIDTKAEQKRLTKQKEQTLKAVRGIEAKLANENFLNKAKPEVVAQTRERLNELTKQLESIEEHLAQLPS